MSSKAHCPQPWGERVGGVSGRPTREGGRSDPFDRPSSRRWKASGLQEGGTLRGAPSERRSWSVRHVRRGSSSACGRTDDKRCSSDAEEGNDVSPRPKMREHPTRGLARPLAPRGRVLCSVRRPVHVNRGSTHGGKPSRGHALSGTSRSGKPGQPGGTGTGVVENGRSAARRAPSLLAREPHGASEKEGGCGLRPFEESRARVEVPARRSSCRSR